MAPSTVCLEVFMTIIHLNPVPLWRALGREIPENLPVLAGELGQSEYIFQVPSGGAQADLYHQRHRGFQPPAAQGDQGQIGVSNRRQPAENAVSGDDGHHEKVDGTAAGLERDPCAAVHLFCRTHARITPPEPDVKGLRAAVHGAPITAALPPPLTSTPAGVILHTRRQSDKSAAAHNG